MKLGIIGLPGAGKKTVFSALTRQPADSGRAGESQIGTISVPDTRIDVLGEMHHPRKITYAQVEYFLPGIAGGTVKKHAESIWTPVRDCLALIHVIRNFRGSGFGEPAPFKDFQTIDQDLLISDLASVEKRLERLDLDKKRGKKIDPEEHSLLIECLAKLEEEIPLRKVPEICEAQKLRGFAFFTAKPLVVLLNNDEDNDAFPPRDRFPANETAMVIKGKLEQELAQMTSEEAEEFLAAYEIKDSAMDRVIRESYDLLGLISFFTIGKDEIRAWTVKRDTPALEAAGAVHTDMQKGFIRAEVLAYGDLMDAGSYNEAKKRGTVRLEGKTYTVQDGDIIEFRFNV
ncbi:MAG TPA: redox-regulated ATPase YchF [Deltaproteobacteria bacterium]|nr:redox-regulated ATPase YchF [Deltaproteobacteria bacterium]